MLPKMARHRTEQERALTRFWRASAQVWPVLAYVVPVAAGLQKYWVQEDWPLWVTLLIVGTLLLLGVLVPQRLKAIGEGRAIEEQRDALLAAETLSDDVVDTATTGLLPMAVALERVGGARGKGEIDKHVEQLERTAIVAAKTLAPRGNAHEGGRACLYLWSDQDQVFLCKGRPQGRSDLPRERFTLEDVRSHAGFRRMFGQNVPQVDSDINSRAQTILGNPDAVYKSFVSAGIFDATGRNVYGFISVDHSDEGRMDDNDARILQTICQLLAAGLARSSTVDKAAVPHLTGQECNTRDTKPYEPAQEPTKE